MQNSENKIPIYLDREELELCEKENLIVQILLFQKALEEAQWESEKENIRMFEITGYVMSERDTAQLALKANLGAKKSKRALKALEGFKLDRYRQLMDTAGDDLPYPTLPDLSKHA